MQRITAVALVPLSLWFVAALVSHTGADHAAVTAWLGTPAVAVLVALTVAVAFYHNMLGLEVVIDDYVHTPARRRATLLALRLASAAAAVAGVAALWSIAAAG